MKNLDTQVFILVVILELGTFALIALGIVTVGMLALSTPVGFAMLLHRTLVPLLVQRLNKSQVPAALPEPPVKSQLEEDNEKLMAHIEMLNRQMQEQEPRQVFVTEGSNG